MASVREGKGVVGDSGAGLRVERTTIGLASLCSSSTRARLSRSDSTASDLGGVSRAHHRIATNGQQSSLDSKYRKHRATGGRVDKHKNDRAGNIKATLSPKTEYTSALLDLGDRHVDYARYPRQLADAVRQL